MYLSSADPCKSLVHIRAPNAQGNVARGTGFVIFKDQNSVYILTCRHVIGNQPTGKGELLTVQIETEGKLTVPAREVFYPDKEKVDLAVLRCDSSALNDIPVLALGKYMMPQAFEIASYQRVNERGGSDEAKLTFHTLIGSPTGEIPILELLNSSVRPIRPGNSGSPVIESLTRRVVAIVTNVKEYVASKAEDNVIFALPVDRLEQWSGRPAGLIVEALQLPATVRPVAAGLIAGKPVQILIAASDGLDNEVAIVQETVNRTRNSPAARDFPVELYRWAEPVQPLGESADTPELDEYHGFICLVRKSAQLSDLGRLQDLLSRMGRMTGQSQRRIVVYRLGEGGAKQPAADDLVRSLRADRDVECPADAFAECFWNDYQRVFPELVDLGLLYPRERRSPVKLRSAADVTPPYRGLESYSKEDAPLFHGRTSEITELRNILAQRTHGLLAVVGPSGSGKSSLIRAGLLYRLDLNAISGSARWKTVDLLLSKHGDREPALALAYEMLEQVFKAPDRDKYQRALRLSNDLVQKPDKVIDDILSGEPPQTRFILFIDQFEELFTIVHDPNAIAAFQICLLRLAQTPRVNVILTMRDDFYARLLKTDLSTMVESQQPFWLKPADDRSLLNAIYLPAALSGYSFEDQNLIVQILRDAGSGSGNLPLLSYALESLVKEAAPGKDLTWTAYNNIGRVQGVIQKQANQVLAGLDDKGEMTRALFRRLITVSESGVATKTPARVDSTWTKEELDLKVALVNARLLITRVERSPAPGDPPPASVVEIAHEALLNDWELMRDWIKTYKAALVLMQDVQADAVRWRNELDTTRIATPVTGQEWEDIRVEVDRKHLWRQEQLDNVDAAIKSLGLSRATLLPAVQDFIRREDERLITELEQPVSHKRRAEIGERLAELGDPRRGVGLRNGCPDLVWCRVPAGAVSPTDSAGKFLGKFDVKPFYMARYPITMAQFKVFTPREIYENERWWADLAVEPKTHTVYPQAPTPNHPAQFVSWYQGIAFCRWLSEQLRYVVRLPTEWEWVQAATCGNQDYLYPWGQEWDPAKANHRGGAYRLMAVGMYPIGKSPNCPDAPLDMSGNMFEWCLNEFDHPAVCDLAGTAARTTRGGAWFSTSDEMTVRYRLRDNPTGFNKENRRLGVCIRLAAENPPPESVFD